MENGRAATGTVAMLPTSNIAVVELKLAESLPLLDAPYLGCSFPSSPLLVPCSLPLCLTVSIVVSQAPAFCSLCVSSSPL